MIQVDVFWSFAFGASFAALNPEGIKRCESMFINKYFVFTVSYLAMIFAPSGIYLLWHHTGWESMFFLDKTLHGIWPCIFAHTNVSLGVLGYMLCYKLIKSGKESLTHPIWVLAYTCMFAILTFGYDRFLYAGTLEEWRAGVKYEITDFFSCEVFHALLVMGIFVAPPLGYPMIWWPRQYGMTSQQKSAIIKTVFTAVVGVTLLFAVGFVVLLQGGHLPPSWGYDRLKAFLAGQAFFWAIIFLPLVTMPKRKPRTKKQE